MLSFAIISEVSATGNAEINGTVSNPSLGPTNIVEHDIAGERYDAMQDHVDDFKAHNEQNHSMNLQEILGIEIMEMRICTNMMGKNLWVIDL